MKPFFWTLSPICLLACSCATHKLAGEAANETPKLLKPVVKKVWIPPEIRNGGSEWVDGHYVYKIDQGTQWSR